MGFESNYNGSGNNSSSTATAEHNNSLRAQVEAEKQAKIEELLAPYRVKRAELQAKREELAEGLAEVDKALNELDGVITQVETSVGLHPSNPKRKKAAHKKHTTHASVDQDWVIQKLRERHMSFNELTRLAKEENFKPASVRAVLTKLTDANLVRVTDGEHYEIV
ncbi:MAG TPA: hypothetical protein VGP94_01600 [Tepidisphaeraceae bacterium]|jgi:hypothetical protein|nr:hypothetical protein [Tepidisphaeraceae bacterium]